MGFLTRLLSSDERSADSIATGGLIAIVAVCTISATSVIRDHREFNPFTFGTGVATIIAAIGGGKTLRDRYSPAGDPPVLPSEGPPNAGT